VGKSISFLLHLVTLQSNAIIIYKYRETQRTGTFKKNPTKIEEIQQKNLLTKIEPLQLAF